MEEKKKIYFCGSIRGGTQDRELYFRMISRMKEEYRVLTEHIGSPELFNLEADQTDEDIFSQDMNWLRESDFVVAECSTPSLGVGYEVAMAQVLGKKTYVLFRSRDRFHGLSAMISGDPYYEKLPYTTEEELFEILSRIMQENH